MLLICLLLVATELYHTPEGDVCTGPLRDPEEK